MDLAQQTERAEPGALDIVEHVLIAEDYPYERAAFEAHFSVQGAWADHELWFAWRDEIRVLELCLAIDLRTPRARRTELYRLVARINELLTIGHFEVLEEERALLYRSTVPVLDAPLTLLQVSTLIAAALDAADRFYPAFNFLVWAGKSAREAIEAAMFDTAGEA
jgi:hypothetical protein